MSLGRDIRLLRVNYDENIRHRSFLVDVLMVVRYFRVLSLKCLRLIEAYLVEREILHRTVLRHLGKSTGNIPKNAPPCDQYMLFLATFRVSLVR
jgi:hypothetical protein